LPPVPIACTHHDIECELLRRRAQHVDRPLLQRYLLFQADRVERVAREMCPHLALNVMMSEVDAQRLRAVAPRAADAGCAERHGHGVLQTNGTAAVAGRVVFVGPTHSHPNRDAVEFLLQEIWPRVRAADRSTSLRLVGGNQATDSRALRSHAWRHRLGYVPDLGRRSRSSLLRRAIRIGRGTRLKILDAWAMGKAVVSTLDRVRGLEAVDGENILIRDAPDAIADAVLQVLRDDTLRSHLERNGRCVATERYSWSIVGQGMRSAYDRLLNQPPHDRR